MGGFDEARGVLRQERVPFVDVEAAPVQRADPEVCAQIAASSSDESALSLSGPDNP